MAIVSVTCRCGATLDVGTEHAGQHSTCPACGASLMVPHPSACTEIGDLNVNDSAPRAMPLGEKSNLLRKQPETVEAVNAASQSPNARRSHGDQLVQMLDEHRRLGIEPHTDDLYMPVDCPECGAFFNVHEIAYRRWRDGENQDMLCPHCFSVFKEADFGTVWCSTCGAESGKMPGSLCRHYTEPQSHWRCSACWAQVAREEMHSEIEQNSRAPATPGPSECLVLAALAGGLGLLITWTF
jgi:hypothetical protein